MLGWEKRINGNKSLESEDSGRDIWVGLRKRAMGWGGCNGSFREWFCGKWLGEYDIRVAIEGRS